MTIKRTRELLGDLVMNLTDEAITELISSYLQIADVLLETSVAKLSKNQKKDAIQ